MSRSINPDILVSEAGELLIYRDEYRDSLSYLPMEEVNDDYVKILGLPLIRDRSNAFHPLLLITFNGELMMINKEYPQGLKLELDLPPLKRLYDVSPLGVLDIYDTLHFVDIIKAIQRYTPEFYCARYNNWLSRSKNDNSIIRSIRNAENISYLSSLDSVCYACQMVILTQDKEMGIYSVFSIVRGTYFHRDESIKKMIGDFIFRDSGVVDRIQYSQSGPPILIRLQIITYPIIDIIMSWSNWIFYTLDNQGIIREHNTQTDNQLLTQLYRWFSPCYGTKIIETTFKPKRFVTIRLRIPAVEDIDGNIYVLSELLPLNYPVKLMNPGEPLLQGRSLKSARTVL